jgi:hypothetical protein
MNYKNVISCPCREGQAGCLECGGKGWVRVEDANECNSPANRVLGPVVFILLLGSVLMCLAVIYGY